MFEPHQAEGRPVITVIGNDGVRYACDSCNETVYFQDSEWHHFDSSLDVQ